mgnify:CR=1 FL=1
MLSPQFLDRLFPSSCLKSYFCEMGRKPTDKQRIEDPKVRAVWAKRLMPLLLRGELHEETMAIIAQKAGVSKATFYKHYSSKESVLSDVVELKIEQISTFAALLFDENESYAKRYNNALQTVSEELAGISNVFLIFLKNRHPKLWKKIDDLTELATKSFEAFYEQGIEEDILENFNVNAMALTDRIIIDALTDPNVLIENNISIATFIEEYFLMKSKAIFKNN